MSVNIQLLNKLLLNAKESLKQKEYERANDEIKQLHKAIGLLFSHEEFSKNMFSSPSGENLPLRKLLLEIDDFFQREVQGLTITSQEVVDELSSLKAANKMKKAYGK